MACPNQKPVQGFTQRMSEVGRGQYFAQEMSVVAKGWGTKAPYPLYKHYSQAEIPQKLST